MEPETSTEPKPKAPLPDRRGPTRIAVLLAVIALIAAATGGLLAYREIQELRVELDRRTDELAWSLEVHQQFHGSSEISPEVGVIQFVDRGYSIEFETVNYTPSGLELEGFVGNPTTLWVTQLTLDFWAYRPFYLKREDFMKEAADDRIIFVPDEVGHAQSQTISTLGPGRRAPFRVTVPNVVQTKEGFTLTVSFSGERYSYAL